MAVNVEECSGAEGGCKKAGKEQGERRGQKCTPFILNAWMHPYNWLLRSSLQTINKTKLLLRVCYSYYKQFDYNKTNKFACRSDVYSSDELALQN